MALSMLVLRLRIYQMTFQNQPQHPNNLLKNPEVMDAQSCDLLFPVLPVFPLPDPLPEPPPRVDA